MKMIIKKIEIDLDKLVEEWHQEIYIEISANTQLLSVRPVKGSTKVRLYFMMEIGEAEPTQHTIMFVREGLVFELNELMGRFHSLINFKSHKVGVVLFPYYMILKSCQ